MRKYSIFLKIEDWSNEAEIGKQFKKNKKIFMKLIEPQILEKKIIISKKQETSNAVDLSLDEAFLDTILDCLRQTNVVDTIDAEYVGVK
jgi:hypothetical protein